ncbi:FERM, ARHGEF and pleckstrin domain-containing protein 2 isoform X2 [Budorcas taxicolor]|uniref:FERM, ARHGEF and pleckstrin domain-containing protein 2 isoform X2 n=1 Tax=Budorcas taxicolor TaxID=37181 RepID=UPI002283EE96|nr:FERM, ARHGEF and pleckstrin domain-containing protein 2 isoform X2 [Budorcas taxicolor]
MGELEGTYRVLQTPGARLGTATPAGVSTLEPGQGPPAGVVRPAARTHLRVQLLDDSVELFDVEPKCDGQVLLTQVWQRLNLIECDYFGLEFQNVQSCWIWLEPMKPIIRQVQRPKNAVLRLAVKFFPPDPGQLQEEYTRYLFALQLKRDLLEERLTCTDTTAALLASHLLQAEVGDYDEVLDREHLRTHEYVPRQERALHRILAFHRELAGQTPAESDFQVLEIARKLDMYGIRFHSASDREGAKIKLAVSHTGILVFQSSTRINTFNWSRLRKLSFKRKRFLIKLHPEVHGPYQDTLEFVLGSRDECKSFWKICVEHHTFFRLSDQPKPKAKAVLFSRGSSFRYSGRTQKQLADYVKGGGMKRAPYERRHSKTRMSLRALKVDLPRQSISLSEGVKTPATPLPTAASFCSAPASPPVPPGPRDSQVGGSSSETGPPAPGAQRPAAERSSVAMAQLPRLPALQPHQGLSVESPQPSPSTQRSLPGLSPQGPAAQGPSPLLGPVLADAAGARTDDREEPRCKWFRSAVVKADAMPADLMTLLFSNIDPIYEFHRSFLREVEQRLVLWEESSSTQATGSHQRIGDILLRNMLQLKALTGHFQRLHEILTELEAASRRLRRLEALRRDFELQKVCYLPLDAFLLKPLQRLRHYRLLLRRLCAPVPGDPDPRGQDHTDLRDALQAITEVTSELQHSLVQLESLQKLTELQRDLVGIESLVAPGRVEDRESERSVPHCFTIYAARKTIVVAASTRLEKAKWLHDLNAAIDAVKTGSAPAPPACVLCPLPRGFPDEASIEPESEDEAGGARGSVAGTGQLRASTTAHVCWCRQTSVSRADRSAAGENQLSGYLLRKFKNSSGWQKLWVVFTNFCLFFYKTHQDDHPLASLPLLGYSVSLPRDTDSIHKEHVFKLQFKSHVYFFRAESKYTFRRWMEVIESASASAGRAGTPEEEA